MSKFDFVGAAYLLRSVNYDCQRCVNLFPVKSETGNSKSVAALYGTPGLLTFASTASAPTRGGRDAQGRAFFVVGNTLFEIMSDGTSVSRGELQTSVGFVSLSNNQTQLVLVDGPYGYVLTLADNTFTQITAEGFYGADTVTYCDGYFLFNKPDTGVYYISSLGDGTMEDPLDFASAEGSPDNIVAIMTVHNQPWIFGTNSIEVVFDAGGQDFPFQRIQGAFIEYGCVSAGSVAKTANTIFWLGQDSDGQGIVWMATGYQPQRISTFAIEYLLQQYDDLSDVSSYTYQEDGHYFYVLNLPDTTIVFDINQQLWHERRYYNLDSGEYERHRGQAYVFAFGKHLLGDYENGTIYTSSLSIYDDDGNPKKWLRVAPHISDGDRLEYVFYDRLQIDMETGVGLIDGGIQDTDPQVMLRWSDDGGHTWSNEHWRSAGKIGEYKKRLLWRKLGRSRDRVFEASGTSNTKVAIIAANILPRKGTS